LLYYFNNNAWKPSNILPFLFSVHRFLIDASIPEAAFDCLMAFLCPQAIQANSTP